MNLGFEEYMIGLCIFRFNWRQMCNEYIADVHVDDIFAVGKKDRFDRLCVDLNRMVPVRNLCKLKWC